MKGSFRERNRLSDLPIPLPGILFWSVSRSGGSKTSFKGEAHENKYIRIKKQIRPSGPYIFDKCGSATEQSPQLDDWHFRLKDALLPFISLVISSHILCIDKQESNVLTFLLRK